MLAPIFGPGAIIKGALMGAGTDAALNTGARIVSRVAHKVRDKSKGKKPGIFD